MAAAAADTAAPLRYRGSCYCTVAAAAADIAAAGTVPRQLLQPTLRQPLRYRGSCCCTVPASAADTAAAAALSRQLQPKPQ